MRYRSLLPTLLVIALSALASVSAHAEGKVILPADIHSIERLDGRIEVGTSTHAGGFCQPGAYSQFDILEDYFLPPNDMFFTLIDPATCTECTETGTVTVDRVHVTMNFRTACNQPVLVSIVEARNACPEPDLTKVLMAPIEFNLPSPGPGTFQFDLNLGTPVCVRGKAFLNITVDRFGTGCEIEEQTTPNLAYADTNLCQPCHYYNYYTDGAEISREHLCRTAGRLTPGPFLHWVSGNCCPLVPTLPATWGQIKMRYAPRRGRRRLAMRGVRVRRPREGLASRA